MKTINTTLAIILLIFLPLGLLAQSSVQDDLATKIGSQSYLKLQSTVDCSTAFTSIEKRICANLEFQREQQEMDSILNVILAFYESEAMTAQSDALILEQQQWQTARIEDCISQHGTYDEALISESHLVTFTDFTAQRRDALAKVAMNLEGSMIFGAAGKDKDK